MDGPMGCDFCSRSTSPAWLYPTEDFEMMPGHISTGGWLACDGCAELIEAADWLGLAERAGERIGDERATHAALALHFLWRRHRDGERTAWG